MVKNGRQVHLYSYRGYDWNRRLSGLAEALVGIPCPLRGDPTPSSSSLRQTGSPDFAGLQAAMAAGRAWRSANRGRWRLFAGR